VEFLAGDGRGDRVSDETMRAALEAADAEIARRASTVAAGARRHRYHLMAPVGWMSDPNGFVQFRGRFHLFFQFMPYYPESAEIGVHWGHVVSDDLVHWRVLPTALAPSEDYDRGSCMSGSALVDRDGNLVVIYSGAAEGGVTQNVAVSDDGIVFRKSETNPVIPVPPEGTRPDFRDPKMVEIDGVVFAVLGGSGDGTGRALLYRASDDLLEWTYVGVAAESPHHPGLAWGHHGTMWECPDLFPLGDRFALVYSPMNGMVDTVPVVEVGTFDSTAGTFAAESRHVLDAGDLYAVQTMVDASGRRVLIGWMRHWHQLVATADEGWVGAMSIPRELVLVDGRVRQRPVQELEKLRGDAHEFGPVSVGREALWADTGVAAEVRVVLGADTVRRFRIGVRAAADRSEQTCFVVDRDAGRVVCDRSLSGKGEVTGSLVEFDDPSGDLELRFFIDTSSIELFVDDGVVTLTHCVYPAESSTGFYIEPIGDGAVEIRDLTIWPLAPR
jgi:beta-fructofuranosidase